MSEKETVKVAFVRDSYDGDIVAVFPEVKHSYYGSDVVMYLHHGQHTQGSIAWAKQQETPSLEEIIPLYNELHARGYDMILTTL